MRKVLFLTMLLAAGVVQAADPPSSGGQDKPSVISEGKEAVKDGTRTIGHFFRDTARAIGHGARDAGRAVGEAAKGTGDAASDVWRKVTGDAPK